MWYLFIHYVVNSKKQWRCAERKVLTKSLTPYCSSFREQFTSARVSCTSSDFSMITHSTHFITHSTLSKFGIHYPLHPFHFPLHLFFTHSHYPLRGGMGEVGEKTNPRPCYARSHERYHKKEDPFSTNPSMEGIAYLDRLHRLGPHPRHRTHTISVSGTQRYFWGCHDGLTLGASPVSFGAYCALQNKAITRRDFSIAEVELYKTAVMRPQSKSDFFAHVRDDHWIPPTTRNATIPYESSVTIGAPYIPDLMSSFTQVVDLAYPPHVFFFTKAKKNPPEFLGYISFVRGVPKRRSHLQIRFTDMCACFQCVFEKVKTYPRSNVFKNIFMKTKKNVKRLKYGENKNFSSLKNMKKKVLFSKTQQKILIFFMKKYVIFLAIFSKIKNIDFTTTWETFQQKSVC